MPYLGDAPTNPIPLVLSGGSASGTVTGPSDHDRHVCWFSVPAQSAGNSILLETPADSSLELCLLWDGGTTAHYGRRNREGNRQAQVYRPIPPGETILIGVFPSGVARPSQSTDDGQDAALGAPRTAAEWGTAIGSDLTKRLPADIGLNVTIGATSNPEGSTENPLVVDFTASLSPVTLDVSAWSSAGVRLAVTLPAGKAIRLTDGGSLLWPVMEADAYDFAEVVGSGLIIKPTNSVFTVNAVSSLPVGTLQIAAVDIANLSGSAIDVNGVSAEPVNVLLFRLSDAVQAVQAPSGSYAFQNVVQGDYVAVAFSREDGRDVVATNVIVPPAVRQAGGGYLFGI